MNRQPSALSPCKTNLRSWLGAGLILLALLLLMAEPALAAPGGKIVSGFAKTWWGKSIMAVLGVVLIPFSIWAYRKEQRAMKLAHAQLETLGQDYPEFDWMRIKQRATECYQRVHEAWGHQDLERADEWMTSWYWQNQQLVSIEGWARDGLENVCRIKKIGSVKPVYVHFAPGGENAEGSQVVVSITATIEDYLKERATQKIVEGKKGFSEETHLYTLELSHGVWRVSNIESDDVLWDYLALDSGVPTRLPVAETDPREDRATG